MIIAKSAFINSVIMAPVDDLDDIQKWASGQPESKATDDDVADDNLCPCGCGISEWSEDEESVYVCGKCKCLASTDEFRFSQTEYNYGSAIVEDGILITYDINDTDYDAAEFNCGCCGASLDEDDLVLLTKGENNA